ncbi:MAG: hypothetical protein O2971_13040 [Proteobacteria bacterium]|nr:hypothetical protein [Pseudomonadota bacterium]
MNSLFSAASPVASRRFNPEFFLRIRNQTGSYWDFGYGHESNGQQIDNPEAYEQEFQSYVADNQPGIFARDGISRGWDYVSVDWEKQWPVDTLPILDGTTVTHFEFRRFLSNGLLQGRPEEYYQWEDGGDRDRPRQLYDGLNMSLQYLFSRRYCTSGENFCLEKLELNQTTGYRDILEHNTSTLELTTNILGLPLQLWAKSGYNSDLVDYYDYTNSWGIGLEFVSN